MTVGGLNTGSAYKLLIYAQNGVSDVSGVRPAVSVVLETEAAGV